jgi:hypothetical protein
MVTRENGDFRLRPAVLLRQQQKLPVSSSASVSSQPAQSAPGITHEKHTKEKGKLKLPKPTQETRLYHTWSPAEN